MEIGMIGLGRMGMNMARRLLEGGHAVTAFNRTPDKTRELAGYGAVAASSLTDLAARLVPPRLVWIMLPAGAPVDAAIAGIKDDLAPGDVIVEGGNSPFQDAPRRAEAMASRGVAFLDAGVSGGVWGREIGYCLMVGGDKAAFVRIEPVLATLAPPGGYMHCGPSGAGHFVKMVHNGIEYGMMQAYAEGFELLDASPFAGGLDYAGLCDLWNRGSVVRSWLLELAGQAFRQDPKLESLAPRVEDSGEGRWMLAEAVRLGVPMPVLAQALFARFASRRDNPFAERMLAALRHGFGGHGVTRAGGDDPGPLERS